MNVQTEDGKPLGGSSSSDGDIRVEDVDEHPSTRETRDSQSNQAVASSQNSSSTHEKEKSYGTLENSTSSQLGGTMAHSGDVDVEIVAGSSLTKKVHEHNYQTIAIGFFAALVMGMLFGLVFEKSRVFEPVIIRRQFLFERWMMLKMFMAAMFSSSLALLVIYKASPSKFEHIRDLFHGCYRRGVFTAVAPGAFLLGAGMSLGGACPGMLPAQLGAGVDTAYATLIGTLAGALAYGLSEPLLEKWIQIGPKFKSFYFDEILKIPYYWFPIGLMVMATAAVVAMEVLEPWYDETPMPNQKTCELFGCKSWPPYAAGLVLGLLQLPAAALIFDTLGASTGYAAVCSLTTHVMTKELRSTKFRRFASQRLGWYNWWQVVYLLGAILGALLSAVMSNSLGDVKGVSPAAGFIGGFLILFGSRLAGGCTSGHGISGMTLMNATSLIAVPFMFAGGIAMAFAYEAVDSTFPYN